MKHLYTWLLLGLGAFDTAMTLIVIKYFGAAEANPFMAWMIAKSIFLFIGFKMGIVVCLIEVVDRVGKPWYLALAFWAYLVIYIISVGAVNAPAHAAIKPKPVWHTAVVTAYANKFENKPMADGRRFHHKDHVAACRAGKLGSKIELRYGKTGRSVVELTDRGSLPLHRRNMWQFDVSRRVARELGLYNRKLGRTVKWRFVR